MHTLSPVVRMHRFTFNVSNEMNKVKKNTAFVLNELAQKLQGFLELWSPHSTNTRGIPYPNGGNGKHVNSTIDEYELWSSGLQCLVS